MLMTQFGTGLDWGAQRLRSDSKSTEAIANILRYLRLPIEAILLTSYIFRIGEFEESIQVKRFMLARNGVPEYYLVLATGN